MFLFRDYEHYDENTKNPIPNKFKQDNNKLIFMFINITDEIVSRVMLKHKILQKFHHYIEAKIVYKTYDSEHEPI